MKRLIFEYSRVILYKLLKILNNIGPEMEPCDTQDNTKQWRYSITRVTNTKIIRIMWQQRI
jgi:hypothetical protein